MVFGDIYHPRFTGQGCWRFTTEKPPELDYGATFYGLNKAGLIPLWRAAWLTPSRSASTTMNARVHGLSRFLWYKEDPPTSGVWSDHRAP